MATEYKLPFTGAEVAEKLTKVDKIDTHIDNKSNPHGVTAGQVGAPTMAEMEAAIAAIPTPDVSGQINEHNSNTSAHNDIRNSISSHTANTSNPHGVTAAQVGAAPTTHNQAASTITAGTFAGQVVANSGGQTPGTSLLRNSKLVSADTNPTVNGEICWTYG